MPKKPSKVRLSPKIKTKVLNVVNPLNGFQGPKHCIMLKEAFQTEKKKRILFKCHGSGYQNWKENTGMAKNSIWCHSHRFSIFIIYFVIAYKVPTASGNSTLNWIKSCNLYDRTTRSVICIDGSLDQEHRSAP